MRAKEPFIRHTLREIHLLQNYQQRMAWLKACVEKLGQEKRAKNVNRGVLASKSLPPFLAVLFFGKGSQLSELFRSSEVSCQLALRFY